MLMKELPLKIDDGETDIFFKFELLVSTGYYEFGSGISVICDAE